MLVATLINIDNFTEDTYSFSYTFFYTFFYFKTYLNTIILPTYSYVCNCCVYKCWTCVFAFCDRFNYQIGRFRHKACNFILNSDDFQVFRDLLNLNLYYLKLISKQGIIMDYNGMSPRNNNCHTFLVDHYFPNNWGFFMWKGNYYHHFWNIYILKDYQTNIKIFHFNVDWDFIRYGCSCFYLPDLNFCLMLTDLENLEDSNAFTIVTITWVRDIYMDSTLDIIVHLLISLSTKAYFDLMENYRLMIILYYIIHYVNLLPLQWIGWQPHYN